MCIEWLPLLGEPRQWFSQAAERAPQGCHDAGDVVSMAARYVYTPILTSDASPPSFLSLLPHMLLLGIDVFRTVSAALCASVSGRCCAGSDQGGLQYDPALLLGLGLSENHNEAGEGAYAAGAHS